MLLRKRESNKEDMRTVTLQCMVLHNICIAQEKRDHEEIRKLLLKTECRSSIDNSGEAVKARDALCKKLWVEKETRKI